MSLDKRRILIVDDEEDICEVLSWDFVDIGMEVITANSVSEAKRLLKESSFDYVLSDIKMPDGEGVELLDFTRSESINLKGIYLMTGYSDYPEDELRSRGLSGLFKKPLETEKLISAMGINP